MVVLARDNTAPNARIVVRHAAGFATGTLAKQGVRPAPEFLTGRLATLRDLKSAKPATKAELAPGRKESSRNTVRLPMPLRRRQTVAVAVACLRLRP